MTDSVKIKLPPYDPIASTLSAVDDRIVLSHWLPPQEGILLKAGPQRKFRANIIQVDTPISICLKAEKKTYNVGGLCKDQDLPSYDGYTHFAAYLALLRIWMRVFPPAQYSRMSLAGAAPALLSPKTDAFNAAWISRVERQCRRRPLSVPLLPVGYRLATNQASFKQLLEEGRPPSDAQVDRMFSMIDYSLDHNRAPAVGYSWYVLEKRDPNDTDLVADHSSVIIGRRRVGETCQYRVQDNTGEYCAPMREGIRDRCELGRIWLTEDELKRSLYSVTYLR